MTILANPDNRRGLRALTDALVMFALVVLLWDIIDKVKQDELLSIARGMLIILGMGTLFYGSENVTRAISFKAPGISADIAGDAPAAAQIVATAAKTKADQISEEAK